MGGIFVLRSERTHVVVRCGDVGQNGSGGHAHNDVLSYELSIDGVPLIVDSGTYAYTFDVRARNEFRSTRAHNTVGIDGAEIHPIHPERVFELRRFARPMVETCDLSSDPIELVGSHDGYRRLRPPCVHRRRFSLATASGELTIRDELNGLGTHDVKSSLHLAPGALLRRIDETEVELSLGRARAIISFSGVRAGEVTIEEGWISGSYGVRERAPVLVASGRRHLPTTLQYSVAPL
jgi:uncharacterized heparinase superfamily protein